MAKRTYKHDVVTGLDGQPVTVRDEHQHWTPEFLALLEAELKAGASYRSLGHKYGVADGNIAGHFPGYGYINPARPQFHLRDHDRKVAQELLEGGESINSVSTMIGVPRPVLRHHFSEYVYTTAEAALVASSANRERQKREKQRK